MVHLSKISFAKSRGSIKFCNRKVVSDFDYGDYLKKVIYCCHLPVMASISPRWVGRVYSSVDFDFNHYEIKIEEEYTEGAQQTQERAAPSRL